MRKKQFFKAAATVLLLPGGFILAAAAAVIFAVLFAAALYCGLILAAANWIFRRARIFFRSFGKAEPKKEAEARPTLPTPTGKPGLSEGFSAAYRGNGDPTAPVPDPPLVGSTTSFPAKRSWLQ